MQYITSATDSEATLQLAALDTMAKLAIVSVAFVLLLALSHAAPAEKPAEKEDLEAPAEKEDLKTAASHWGGWGGGYGHLGGYGGYGGYGGHWGSPYYSYGYGWPSYSGYGYGWPYGGYGGYGGWGYGGHGYWW